MADMEHASYLVFLVCGHVWTSMNLSVPVWMNELKCAYRHTHVTQKRCISHHLINGSKCFYTKDILCKHA